MIKFNSEAEHEALRERTQRNLGQDLRALCERYGFEVYFLVGFNFETEDNIFLGAASIREMHYLKRHALRMIEKNYPHTERSIQDERDALLAVAPEKNH